MIASVEGRVVAVSPDGAVVEVGGIGFSVQCSPGTVAGLRVGERCRLATSLVVREDSLTLYGFANEEARSVFELLQTASGVGPKLAQAALGVLGADGVRAAIVGEDLAALTRVPGIGRKGAQRIVLELRDRFGAVAGALPAALGAGGPPAWRLQLAEALVGLGWSGREAEEAISAVTPEAQAAIALGEQPDVAGLLRSCLRSLSHA